MESGSRVRNGLGFLVKQEGNRRNASPCPPGSQEQNVPAAGGRKPAVYFTIKPQTPHFRGVSPGAVTLLLHGLHSVKQF